MIRGGWSRTSPFNTAWVESLRGAVERWFTATIVIYTTDIGDLEYDTKTGTYEPASTPVPVFEGKARVQPIRTARALSNNAADTVVRSVRVQIADTALKLGVNFRMKVLESELSPSMQNFNYTIYDVLESTNPFERTFEAQVDTEARS